MASTNEIRSKFENLPTISEDPMYESINNIIQTLYGNELTLTTPLGGGSEVDTSSVISPSASVGCDQGK